MTELDQEHWPCPRFDEDDEPHFIFILTPPYSGSTAIAQFLATSPNVGLLAANGEGQQFVPGIHRDWNAQSPIVGASVRSSWLHRYQAIDAHGKISLIVEKSPTNIVRIQQLVTLFKRTTCLASIRHPVATCSSAFFRNTKNYQTITALERQEKLRKIALRWAERSSIIMHRVRENDLPFFTYEQFCTSPEVVVGLIEQACSERLSTDTGAALKIKDYPPARIENMNTRQIARLTQEDIRIINKTLSEYRSVTDFFGYSPDMRCVSK